MSPYGATPLFSDEDNPKALDEASRRHELLGEGERPIDINAQGNPRDPIEAYPSSDGNPVGRTAALGNPQSCDPSSSRTIVDLLGVKNSGAPETQAGHISKQERRWRRFSCRLVWCDRIDFRKWFEWTAYYIPIIEWLPQYRCMASVFLH